MAASTWSDAVEAILNLLQKNENYAVNLNKIRNGIVEHQLKFYEFVEMLGKNLSDTDEMNRANGCKLLAELLHQLPRGYLTTQEVNFLSSFLRDRLQDKDSVVTHTLHGSVALSMMSNISEEDVVTTVGAILREIGQLNQSRSVTDRLNVFLIFRNFLQSHLNALKTMGLEFVSGFIQTVEGEKDPRNLVVVFHMIPQVIHNFDIGPFYEDLFEATGCYFPIDYSPPINDTKGVTREELILGLRSCLASTPKFAEFFTPMLMEKLDSDIPDAKIDALLTLAACAEVYGSENLRPFYADAYRSIRREVCSNGSVDVQTAALTALTALVKSASATVVLNNGLNDFLNLISEILTECLSNLCEPGMKLTYHSAKLLKATAMASKAACERVINSVVPLLTQQFALKTELQQRSAILDILNGFLEICRRYTQEDFKPCKEFKVVVFNLNMELLSSNSEVNLRRAAIIGLLTIATTQSLLDESEVAAAISFLAKVIINDQDKDVRSEGLAAISRVAVEHPLTTQETLLPHLLNVVNTIDATTDEIVYKNHLLLLAAVTTDVNSLQTVTSKLLCHLDSSLSDGKHLARVNAITECVLDIAEKTCPKVASFWSGGVLTDLLNLAYRTWPNLIQANKDTLLTFTKIYQTVVPHLEAGDATQLLLKALDSFLHSKTQNSIQIAFVECLLSSAKREVISQTPEQYLDTTVTVCLTVIRDPCSLDDHVCLLICRCLASLVNKLADEEHLSCLLTTFLETIRSQRVTVQTSSAVRSRIATLLIWLTKAVTLKGHNSMNSFVEELFAWLEDESMCEQMADGFQFVLIEITEALNDKCHGQVLLFHKQRFFVTTSPRLIEGVKSSKSADIRYAYLKALILQLPLLPKEAFVCDLPTLIPILIKGMICKRVNILLPILTTLSIILKKDPKSVENYADTLIPHLLELSAYKGVLKVRIASLENLNYLTKLPEHLTVQHKQNIIHGLTAVLDDPKRLVRKAAATTRTNWFLLGSPGGT